ncbi:MAG: dihydroneopterin aldolase [Alphaproteobacteria bacterium]
MTDPKILSARCNCSTDRPNTARDKIFVRNLVINSRIGLYDEEQLDAQRVRFSVDMEILPPSRPMQDCAEDIVDYEMIVTIIKGVVETGHINLVETMAERIAHACLAIPRAAKVRVLIEKLDRYENASLGVEIERAKSASGGARIFPLPRSGGGEGA